MGNTKFCVSFSQHKTTKFWYKFSHSICFCFIAFWNLEILYRIYNSIRPQYHILRKIYLVVYITYFFLKHFGDKWIGDHIHLATKKYYYGPKKIIRITFLTVPIIRKLVWQSISLKTIQNVFFFLGSNKSFECTCNSHFVSWKPFFTLLIILQRNKKLIICIFIAYGSIDMQLRAVLDSIRPLSRHLNMHLILHFEF